MWPVMSETWPMDRAGLNHWTEVSPAVYVLPFPPKMTAYPASQMLQSSSLRQRSVSKSTT